MRKTKCLTLCAAAWLALGLTMACQTRTGPASEVTSQTTVNAATNSNQTATVPATNAGQTMADKTEAEKSSVAGSLASPTAAYKTAYAVRQKKDVAGMKRVFSKKMIDFFTGMAQAEHKTLDDELKEMFDSPQAATDESRNEKIAGDTATLEYPDAQGKWKTMDFVKEGGDWKLTLPSRN